MALTASANLTPYAGPCDCAVRNGSGIEGGADIILAHCDFGDPCGYLLPILRGDRADIVYNECAAVARTVSMEDLQHTLDGTELSLDVASEICPKMRSGESAFWFLAGCWLSCVGCWGSVQMPGEMK